MSTAPTLTQQPTACPHTYHLDAYCCLSDHDAEAAGGVGTVQTFTGDDFAAVLAKLRVSGWVFVPATSLAACPDCVARYGRRAIAAAILDATAR